MKIWLFFWITRKCRIQRISISYYYCILQLIICVKYITFYLNNLIFWVLFEMSYFTQTTQNLLFYDVWYRVSVYIYIEHNFFVTGNISDFHTFLYFNWTVLHFPHFWLTALLICFSQPRWRPRLTLIPPALCFIVYTSGGKQERRVRFRHKSSPNIHPQFHIHRLCLTSWLYF